MTMTPDPAPDPPPPAVAAAERPPLVRARGVRKHFGGAPALGGVDLDLFPGEVHGLVGANGAGKSTLIRVLAGLEQPDAGSLVVDGRAVHLAGPRAATALGFGFIHQELHLVPHLTALENLVLGAPLPTRLGLVDWRRVRARVDPVARQVGITFPLDAPAATLSTAQGWLVSIGRALVRRVRLLVLDEPTASLSVPEADNLFRIVRRLAADGVAVLYVSHRLDEILSLCDRVTAFRDGRRVLHASRGDFGRAHLVEAIVGGVPAGPPTAAAAAATAPARALAGPLAAAAAPDAAAPRTAVLTVRDLRRGRAVRGVSLEVSGGEVLGLAGLVGAGRTELVRLVFGADQPDAGSMTLDGRPFAPRSPAAAVRAGVGLVPEERRSQGLVIGKSVAFNLGLTVLPSLRVAPWWPLLDRRRQAARARELTARLRVKTPDVHTPVGRLSGGNQQKVVVGKWLARRPRLLILDEPSRGVDVGARAELHRLVRDLAADGTAVVVISSEAEELPGLCDRVLVMAEGRIVDELSGAGLTREALVRASYRHPAEPAGPAPAPAPAARAAAAAATP